jgi:hypothetical protein
MLEAAISLPMFIAGVAMIFAPTVVGHIIDAIWNKISPVKRKSPTL